MKNVASSYARFHNMAKASRAENAILTPLGLDNNSFIARQHEMSESFITSLTKELLNFEVPSVAAIIAGNDPIGTHIYSISGDSVNYMNSIGFASIGIGSRHADSQFMVGRHSTNSPLPETLLLAYAAKKRAEISPGVGKEEDYFYIGEALGSLITNPNPEIIKKLKQEYAKVDKNEKLALAKSKKAVQQHVDDLSKATTAQPQKVSEPATDGKAREEPANRPSIPKPDQDGKP